MHIGFELYVMFHILGPGTQACHAYNLTPVCMLRGACFLKGIRVWIPMKPRQTFGQGMARVVCPKKVGDAAIRLSSSMLEGTCHVVVMIVKL